MRIVRFKRDDEQVRLGVIDKKDNIIIDITAIDPNLTSVITLHKKSKTINTTPSHFLMNLMNESESIHKYSYSKVHLLTPVVAPEIWACGVTYQGSRKARNIETSMKETVTFYDKVYTAERPELFLKSTDSRVRGPEDELYLRSDSKWQVPEPELCLVLTSEKEIIGYTIGNDMSCRDIEGENPLYLPQAKIWKASCSFGPAIRLADSVTNPYDFDIICRIIRQENIVFEGKANTSELNRTYESLIEYLFKDNEIYDGTVLMTGTSIVPPDEFTLQHGDSVEIEIPSIGILINPIVNNGKFFP